MPGSRLVAAIPFLFAVVAIGGVSFGQDFANWETPTVHPLELAADGTSLVAVNSPDGRLEVFDVDDEGALVPSASIPVGIDPVSVRFRSDTEVWVVNHLSDSVSVIDLTREVVVATISTLDEPCDVVFAGDPERAFVSCSQANAVLVFDPADLSAAPDVVEILGEEPRALAVSTDGAAVYVAVFESGNQTTVLGGIGIPGDSFPPNVVSHPDGPYEGENPAPSDGDGFTPPENDDNPAAPENALIVRKNSDGNWLDGNDEDWTAFVSGDQSEDSGRPEGWDLLDHDLAVIDTDTLDVEYVTGLMNLCMGLAVNGDDGRVSVVGTEALNETRFEPILNGRFLRVQVAFVDVSDGSADIHDLNPHLDYTDSTVELTEREKSVGDPRAVLWNAAGDLAYVCGKGSDNVVSLDTTGARTGTVDSIAVGEGPSGLALDEERGRLYVLNQFAGSISIIDTELEEELEQVSFFDPTPDSIQLGRKHLYSTHRNSGLGHIACGSCHIDGRMDRLAWDLGDPAGEMREFNQNCLEGFLGTCDDWHPMKGPMLTQTLRDIIGKEPFHWRGDRDGIEEFNGAFLSLQSADSNLSDDEMQEFEDFLATLRFPPNPFRNLDNSLPEDLPLPGHFTTGRFDPAGEPLPNGDAVQGLLEYRAGGLDGGLECVTCHTLPTGMGRGTELSGFPPSLSTIDLGPNGEQHLAVTAVDISNGVVIKVPQLRNAYERTGFNTTQTSNTMGFGFLHDGTVDSIERFISEPVFSVGSDQEVADLVAFMLAFSGSDLPTGNNGFPFSEPVGPDSFDTHAAVGQQVTFDETGVDDTELLDRLTEFLDLADDSEVGLVAHGFLVGEQRGAYYLGSDDLQTDRADETITIVEALDLVIDDAVLTFTVVVLGTEQRIGVDRDRDGSFNRDETDACSDPADEAVVPLPGGCSAELFDRGDCNASGIQDIADPIRILATLFQDAASFDCADACDANDDGLTSVADAITLLAVLFESAPPLPEPYLTCSADLTDDDLDCEVFEPCE